MTELESALMLARQASITTDGNIMANAWTPDERKFGISWFGYRKRLNFYLKCNPRLKADAREAVERIFPDRTSKITSSRDFEFRWSMRP